jgi:16S rRNA G966 N2-methylase RsmD
MEYHSIANIFPMMQDAELHKLADDIKATGLQNKIILYEGKILDGRNRYEACGMAGIEPEYGEYEGNEPLVYVISLNLHRRHLSESQRAVVASRLANMRSGERTDLEPNANLHKVISQPEAAEMLNVSTRMVASVKAIEKAAPEKIKDIESGKITVHQAEKEIKAEETSAIRTEIAEQGAQVPKDKRWCIYHDDMTVWEAPRQYDFIITDPPYPKEYLSLYENLAIQSKVWLKDGGLLIAMCGQSYLDEIYAMMSKHIDYYWTAAYLTPGQPTPLRQVNVNTTWKPLLIFRKGIYKGKIFGDVFKSEGNDKDHHKWGQSVSGMLDIVTKVCLPGQYILDPFCGAGTTGIAALRNGCLFDGIEKDIQNVNIAKGRINGDNETEG